ncbi:acyl carrier protein [Flexivirga sp. ID2601S]|uniref:Acyl carrier protein n=1 Tax=Flexivirga aerilata TaxID=1656889 RepID=A0A849AEN1_9MICO|nr:acyl carrier protein [Flexivirga aerilata]NNG38273.1 acyl carrier protein [Flexivirga aerilata]
MSSFTLDNLVTLLRQATGEADLEAAEHFADTTFTDLGYDSLVLLETAGQISRNYGVVLSDDDLEQIETPRELVERVNAGV